MRRGRKPQRNGERKGTPKKWGERRNSLKGIGKGKTKTGKRKGKNPPKMEEEKIPKKGQR